MNLTEENRQAILDLAADTVVRRLGADPLPLPDLSNPIFNQPAGCFVSLHRKADHALRGCIGMLDTGKPLRLMVVSASESVLGDPRFLSQPVTRFEIPELTVEVTLLGPLQKAKSVLDFEPTRDGIHLSIHGRAGLFLPQVARETGWSREQLLSRLCTEKMGMTENSWHIPAAELRTFSTEVIGPRELIVEKKAAVSPSV
jgi:AmmeMemoRadiSam system protein A